MAPWWPCTLPGTSSSFSSLLHLPGAFPCCCHLPVPSCLPPNAQKSVAGLGGGLWQSWSGHWIPPKAAKAWLSLGGAASNPTESWAETRRESKVLGSTLRAVPGFPFSLCQEMPSPPPFLIPPSAEWTSWSHWWRMKWHFWWPSRPPNLFF